jgi:hypothetical protein
VPLSTCGGVLSTMAVHLVRPVRSGAPGFVLFCSLASCPLRRWLTWGRVTAVSGNHLRGGLADTTSGMRCTNTRTPAGPSTAQVTHITVGRRATKTSNREAIRSVSRPAICGIQPAGMTPWSARTRQCHNRVSDGEHQQKTRGDGTLGCHARLACPVNAASPVNTRRTKAVHGPGVEACDRDDRLHDCTSLATIWLPAGTEAGASTAP